MVIFLKTIWEKYYKFPDIYLHFYQAKLTKVNKNYSNKYQSTNFEINCQFILDPPVRSSAGPDKTPVMVDEKVCTITKINMLTFVLLQVTTKTIIGC